MTTKSIKDTLIATYDHHKKYFFTFITVGIGGTIIYCALFAFLWNVLHINHVMAVTIAFISSATYQFLTNRKVTFKVEDPNFLQQIMRYGVLLVINYLLSIYIMQFALWAFSSSLIGLLLTASTTPVTGYLLFKYWVFKDSITA